MDPEEEPAPVVLEDQGEAEEIDKEKTRFEQNLNRIEYAAEIA